MPRYTAGCPNELFIAYGGKEGAIKAGCRRDFQIRGREGTERLREHEAYRAGKLLRSRTCMGNTHNMLTDILCSHTCMRA